MTAKTFVFGWLAALSRVVGNAAFAQQFAGRVVTIIVNNSAGGPTDIEARIAARHLPPHIAPASLAEAAPTGIV